MATNLKIQRNQHLLFQKIRLSVKESQEVKYVAPSTQKNSNLWFTSVLLKSVVRKALLTFSRSDAHEYLTLLQSFLLNKYITIEETGKKKETFYISEKIFLSRILFEWFHEMSKVL